LLQHRIQCTHRFFSSSLLAQLEGAVRLKSTLCCFSRRCAPLSVLSRFQRSPPMWRASASATEAASFESLTTSASACCSESVLAAAPAAAPGISLACLRFVACSSAFNTKGYYSATGSGKSPLSIPFNSSSRRYSFVKKLLANQLWRCPFLLYRVASAQWAAFVV
jgi:hypothetical protein